MGGRDVRFLDVTCGIPHLEPVFADVADEIIARVARGRRCSDAVESTVAEFRALLDPERQGAVDVRKMAGLVGELLVLNAMLDIAPSSWAAWSGPAGDRHDFRVGGLALEVKASTRLASSKVTINGLDQLHPPDGGRLHLLHVVLEPTGSGEHTVASLGNRALAACDDRAALQRLLTACDCPDVDGHRWNTRAFQLHGLSLYEVRDAFPRLTRVDLAQGMLTPGVSDVTYQIDLAVADEYLLPDERLHQLLTDMTS